MMIKKRDEMQHERLEQKFVVNKRQAEVIRSRVREHLALDPHGKDCPEHSYPVHSVYLDSTNLDAYWSTLNERKNRFKLRVRFYNDDPAQPVYVEVKGKADGQTVKRRCSVTRKQLQELFADENLGTDRILTLKELADLEQFLEEELTLQAQPKLHVAYQREAYVSHEDNSVRVTLDRDIRSEPVNRLRLSTQMVRPRLLCEGDVVIEVKCSREMPRWLARLIGELKLGKSRFTKYGMGIEQHGLNAGALISEVVE